jgi:choline dehydrogenase-like flavoprotein
MTRQFSADVIVVGAGTAGTFFTWRMAQRGYQVILLEGRAFAELGKAIEIIHMEQVRFDEFDIPQPEPPELIHTETVSYTYSPDLKVKLPTAVHSMWSICQLLCSACAFMRYRLEQTYTSRQWLRA